MYALSNFISPLIGSWVYTLVGMRAEFDWVSLSNVVFALILFVFNCGPFFISENNKFVEKLSLYQNAEEEEEEEEEDDNKE